MLKLAWSKKLNRPASIEIQEKLGGSVSILIKNFPPEVWVNNFLEDFEMLELERHDIVMLRALAKMSG